MNNWIKNIGQPIVTLITAILAIIISWKTFWLEGRIKKETHALKTQIELLVQARTELKSERDFYFATLDKVLESIEKGDEDYQTALAAIIKR